MSSATPTASALAYLYFEEESGRQSAAHLDDPGSDGHQTCCAKRSNSKDTARWKGP